MNKKSNSSQGWEVFIDKGLKIMTQSRSAIGSPGLVSVSTCFFLADKGTTTSRLAYRVIAKGDGTVLMAHVLQISRKKGMQGPTICTPQQAIMSGEELIVSISLRRSKQCVTTPFKMSSHCDRNNIPLLLPGWRQGTKITKIHADTIIFKTPAFCFFSFFSNIVSALSIRTLTVLIDRRVALIQNILGWQQQVTVYSKQTRKWINKQNVVGLVQTRAFWPQLTDWGTWKGAPGDGRFHIPVWFMAYQNKSTSLTLIVFFAMGWGG